MILEVRGGAFAYPKKEPLFQNVQFRVASGERLAILGPNGAGKTTLLRAVMGMLPWGAGGAFIDGENIRALSHRRLWQCIAYVPQARSNAPGCTALEAVLLGRSSRLGAFSVPGEKDLAAARRSLARLGAQKLQDMRCCELSGGEYQLVLIARALAAEPGILILDEPESNLDFKNQLIVLEAMESLSQSGLACVFNTHYPEHALQWADTALLLHGGAAHFGAAQDIVMPEALQKAFGVRVAMGEIQTADGAYKSIVPLRLHPGKNAPRG